MGYIGNRMAMRAAHNERRFGCVLEFKFQKELSLLVVSGS